MFNFLKTALIFTVISAGLFFSFSLAVNAGSLNQIQLEMSGFTASTQANPQNINLTADVVLADEISGKAKDQVIISFMQFDSAGLAQFKLSAMSLSDVTANCDQENKKLNISDLLQIDGKGIAPDKVVITFGDKTDTALCSAGSILKLSIINNKITAPITSGIYFINIDILTNGGKTIDSGAGAVYINSLDKNQKNISATDPYLSLNLSVQTCNLGALRADAFKSCSYDVIVGTNSLGGYNAQIQANDELKSGAFTIHKESASADTINGKNGFIDTAELADSEYGIGIITQDMPVYYPDLTSTGYKSCSAINDTNSHNVPIASLNVFNALPFAYANKPVDNGATSGKTTICHIVKTSANQALGVYNQQVMITATANF